MSTDRARTPALAGVAAASVAAFALVATAVTTKRSARFDRRVGRAARRHRSHAADVGLYDFQWVGMAPVHVPLAMLASALVARRRGPRRAAPILLSSLVSVAAHHGLKAAFHRRRPTRALESFETEPSFPSGHTTSSTAVALATAYVLVREGMLPAAAAVPPAVLIPATVGFSRVYFDKHWPTDVLAGWSIGLAIASGCALLYEELAHPRARRSRTRDQRAHLHGAPTV